MDCHAMTLKILMTTAVKPSSYLSGHSYVGQLYARLRSLFRQPLSPHRWRGDQPKIGGRLGSIMRPAISCRRSTVIVPASISSCAKRCNAARSPSTSLPAPPLPTLPLVDALSAPAFGRTSPLGLEHAVGLPLSGRGSSGVRITRGRQALSPSIRHVALWYRPTDRPAT
jgi:hypothetical protein